MSIDLGRVVAAFQADASNFMAVTQKAAGQYSVMAQQAKGFAAATKEATDKAGASHTNMFSLIAKGVQGFVGNIQNMGQNVGKAIFWWKELLNTGVDLVTGLFEQAAAVEKLVVPFTDLLHSTEKAKLMIEDLYHFAAGTPFTAEGITATAQKMLTMGFNGENVIPILTSVGNAVVGVGKGQGAVDQIINGFERMNQTGTVTSLNITSLVRAGIPAWDLLAKGLGVTVPQAMEEVKKHTVNATEAIKALTTGMDKMFPGALAASADTFSGSIKRVQEYWQEATLAFSAPVMKTLEGMMNALATTMASPAFSTFASLMGNLVAGTLSQLFALLTSLGDVIGPIIINFSNWASSGNNLQIALIPVRNFLGDIEGIIAAKLIPAFQGLRDFAQQLIARFQQITSNGKGMNGILTTAATVFGTIANWIGQLITAAGNLLGPILSIAGSFFDWTTNSGILQVALWVVQGALSAIFDIVGAVATGVGSVLTWFHTGQPWAVAAGIALATVAGAFLSISAAMLVMKIANFISLLPTLIGLGWLWVTQMWALVVPWIILNWPILAIGAAVALVVALAILAITHWGQIMTWFGNLFGVIGAWIGDRMRWIGDRLGELKNWFADRLQWIADRFQWVRDRISDAAAWIGARFKWIGDKLGELKQAVGLGLILIGQKFLDFVGVLKDIGGKILDALTWPFRTARDIIGGIVDTVKGWIQDIANFLSNTPSKPSGPTSRLPVTRGHALGGINIPAGWSWVGEKGPEKIWVPGGSTIRSNAASTAGGGTTGAAGPSTFVFRIDSRDLIQALGPAMVDTIRLDVGGQR